MPRRILPDCARRLAGLPVLFVGVRCPINVIMARRREGQAGRENEYLAGNEAEPVPAPVLAWQREVHRPGFYDLEVDTSVMTPQECGEAIRQRLGRGLDDATAFRRLAASPG
jgi:chloramphenicol 3-O phosphotransferase